MPDKIDVMDWATRFAAFVDRKITAAVTARIPGYVTTESNGAALGLRSITGGWASERFDGPFFESEASNPALPAVNTVFVQSSDKNTGAQNPMALGGGLTDKHLIYEGLSSVHIHMCGLFESESASNRYAMRPFSFRSSMSKMVAANPSLHGMQAAVAHSGRRSIRSVPERLNVV